MREWWAPLSKDKRWLNHGSAMWVPACYNCDLSLFKNIPIRERIRAQFRLEAFNAFNLMNFANPATTAGVSSLAVVPNTGSPRTLQLAMKTHLSAAHLTCLGLKPFRLEQLSCTQLCAIIYWHARSRQR
jgi:hypothetical protein